MCWWRGGGGGRGGVKPNLSAPASEHKVVRLSRDQLGFANRSPLHQVLLQGSHLLGKPRDVTDNIEALGRSRGVGDGGRGGGGGYSCHA